MLYSTHLLLSTLVKVPELQIAPAEAEALAASIAAVAAHYDVGASMAPEAIAWMSLVQSLALIYGPRIVAFRMRKRSDAAKDVTPSADAMAQGYGGFPG